MPRRHWTNTTGTRRCREPAPPCRRINCGPNARAIVAVKSNQGSTRSNTVVGVHTRSTAPTHPPAMLAPIKRVSGTPHTHPDPPRYTNALIAPPGYSATELDALAATEGKPAATSAGSVTKLPPPTSAFIAPAINPADTSHENSVTSRVLQPRQAATTNGRGGLANLLLRKSHVPFNYRHRPDCGGFHRRRTGSRATATA